ncbi:hypothetical protein JCM10908_000789 [Rhodotorula pacifica]|uniref:uncharacterized protein n=1 Tax=Rhodotorula pacifica TaxID=1495444 RepID=UPI00317244D6
MAPGGNYRGGGYRGTKRPRGGGGGGGGRSAAAPTAPPPSAPGPLHDLAHLEKTYKGQLVPGSKYLENPKGVIANYVKALGFDPEYKAMKVLVEGKVVFRVTIVADPDPPPPVQRSLGYNSASSSGPSLPPIVQPVVGTGDAPSAKEGEKLAAIDACLQLSQRGLFNKSNLPTRTVNFSSKYSSVPAAPVARGPTYDTAASSSCASAFWDGPSAGGSAYQSSSNQMIPPPVLMQPTQPAMTGPQPGANDGRRVVLQNGAIVGLEEARAFMDYYCNRFGFGRPDLSYTTIPSSRRGGASHWRATLRVGGAQIGVGEARAKKDAMNRAYLDTASYLEGCDPSLWTAWEDKKRNKLVEKGDVQAHVVFEAPGDVEEDLRDAVYESGKSELYKRAREMVKREHEKAQRRKELALLARRGILPDDDADHRATRMELDAEGGTNANESLRRKAESRRAFLDKKSATLLKRLQDYKASSDASIVKLRTQRASLPVSSHASSVLAKIATSSGVVVVLAATGSGKTTQLPQLLLDNEILAGKGAECNIVCTQPRRIAAISVAERVAKERGEQLGDSVGYQVRFEAKPPKKDGSILFCTTGLFLRRMQADLEQAEAASSASSGTTSPAPKGESFLDGVTHVCVDEVHERDVDTDLLLFVLRRLLWERRKQGKKEIKVVLMSATIDPRLFTEYFADPDTRMLAPVIEVPGRSFPVEKRWLDDTINELEDLRLPTNRGGWVLQDKSVVQYLQRELVPSIPFDPRTGRPVGEIDDLDMPYPLLALIIAHVLKQSDDGHVLVFLPGWDEIQAVRNILMDKHRYPLFDLDFANSRDLEIHVLHSSIPLAEQQAVFEPPREGVRRVVLSTNIAETSVTIPDVVYVVDSAKCKEKRYDPERRLSQLVSAWTGTSNVLQRAGRAGRHRAGEYYGIVSKARFASMDIHQTVEMLRTDLASTAMHVTGLQLPGLTVFDVLSSTIQPPEPQRVTAALETLLHVGAIDRDEKLTSLGRVLLQLPVEAAIGKLCLLGSFFRCLDQTLTLAAILTNRDPFLSPPAMKAEADRIKNTWAPTDFRGDPFAILQAYNAWWELQSRADYNAANAFCRDNFLSKPTLLLIQKIKDHLLSSLDRAGALQISAGGAAAAAAPPPGRGRFGRGHAGPVIPPQLNENGNSLPLLAALIATAVAPNFAIRVSEKSLRTSQDRACAIHPSSVNSRKNEKASDAPVTSSKQLYAYAEKSKTGAMSGKGEGQTFLRGTTRLDPLGYMLFGAYSLEVTTNGLECDGWLPIVAPRSDLVSALDDVERLKDILDLSLLRVFEGLGVAITRGRGRGALTGAGNGGGKGQQNQGPNGKGRGRQFDRDDEDENEGDDDAVDAEHDPTLSAQEIKDLDVLTGNVSNLLDSYHHALGPATTANSRVASRASSRPQTPQPPGGNPGGAGVFGASHPPSSLQFSSTSGGWKGRGGLLGGSSAGSSRSGTPYNSRPPSSGGAGGGGGFGSGGGGAASSGGSWRR